MGKHVQRNDYWSNREYLLSSPCLSPQLRMSFIVFSTEGRILMSLTEDRWVQIPSETLLIPLFSIIHLKGMSVIPDLDTGHTQLWSLWVFMTKKTFHTDTFLHCDLSIVSLVWTSASSCCFLTHCGQFMHLIFPQQSFSAATKSFHCFTSSLGYLILQRAHFLSICVTVSRANTQQYCFNSSVTYCWYFLQMLRLWKLLFCYQPPSVWL